MTRPWWKDYPRRHWSELDWKRWERDGRPKVPRDPVLEQQGQPNTGEPVIQPEHTWSGGFSLYPPKSTARDARGRGVDALLAELGIRPRARRGNVQPGQRLVR